MPLWLVIGPEYGEVVPVLDYGEGPLEYQCDVVEVEADTKREARILGIKLLRQEKYLQNYPDENPFAGLEVMAV